MIIPSPISMGSSYTCHPMEHDFMLHNHNDSLEILIFLQGDAQFHVEGNIYPLRPYDTVIATNHEMHRVLHLSDTPYERIVINLPINFFVMNNCEEYGSFFFERALGDCNRISSTETSNSNFRNCVERLMDYSHKEGNASALVKSVLIELLYLLNSCHHHPAVSSSKKNSRLREIISYMNTHLSEDLTVSGLSDLFYMNKSYLCRIFKQTTGYTINKYIAHKRFLFIRELCSQGSSLASACRQAGFGNYSNFYKMYLHETGHSPSQDFQKNMPL